MTDIPTKATGDSPLLPALRRPLVMITPAPEAAPTATALAHLASQCKELAGLTKVFSANTSPEHADPSRSKHHFFTQSPYWWQKSDGTWEHREGQRNPVADTICCQKELEDMAMTVHTLALGWKHLSSPSDAELRDACLARVEKILHAFFVSDHTFMLPQVEYSQCIPGEKPTMKGNGSFIISTRYLILVAQALPLLPSSLPSRSGVEAWFDAHIAWMKTSDQGQEAGKLDKKTSRWYHAALASYLQISRPADSALHANKMFRELMAIDPHPANTLFAPDSRFVTNVKSRHISMFSLEPLFILASMTIPSSTDDSNSGTSDDAIKGSPQTPADDILDWLGNCVDGVEGVKPGAIELIRETDACHSSKLDVFKRLLARWRTGEVNEMEPNGAPWQEGWRDWSKLAWEMI